MIRIESLDNFTEYEPSCDACSEYYNDVQRLNINFNLDDIRLCIKCRELIGNVLLNSIPQTSAVDRGV